MINRLIPGVAGLLWMVTLSASAMAANDALTIRTPANASPRILFAAERLKNEANKQNVAGARNIVLSRATDADCPAIPKPTANEGFSIGTLPDGAIAIVGTDDTGVLYGALDLQQRMADAKRLPAKVEVADAPKFIMRGAVIGMQKTFILPGRKVYEYPYRPELFPFYYDKAFWAEYLDFLVAHRFDTLFLWNGCPFSSLVNVPGYEEALEVPPDVFAKNQEMYHYITAECDKRGIWLVQMFYSIIVPQPMAKKYGTDTQQTAPTDWASDYTRKAIAQFVKEYPQAGLMPCLGEALQGIDNQKFWLNEVTIAGVKDGMKLAGLTEEPPIVIRTHATDLRKILPDTLKIYKNIYTEAKFNGESLTTYEPRGKRQVVHQAMGDLGAKHLINVHILANLEPFRYGAQRFIKQCMQAARDRLHAVGLHLYPLDYWSFPETPDLIAGGTPLKSIDRDWDWYTAWSRYAWNPDIPEAEDHAWWVNQLAQRYGNKEAAEKILAATNDAGECAPRILRRYGITEGNRQTMSLGMTLDELVNPTKYHAFEELWESQSPPGERLDEFVSHELANKPHVGETPVSINAEVRQFSKQAVDSIDAAKSLVTQHVDEFERVRSDIHAIRLMSESYCEKTEAAVLVLKNAQTGNLADLEAARPHLAKSLELYKQLADLTAKTYRFANTMQTSQRRIPFSGGKDGQPANFHWSQLVPLYEKELADFDQRLADLTSGKVTADQLVEPLKPAAVTVISGGEAFTVNEDAKVYTDRDYGIHAVAGELRGLTGIRFEHSLAKDNKLPPILFESKVPVTVLVGYIREARPFWRKVPDLETDASAIDQYTSEPVLQNAAAIDGLPPIDVYGVKFPAGQQTLALRGEGSFVILGIVPQSTPLPKRNAKLGVSP
ncbi:MAG: hypothetical protein JWM57_2711 [Phycisphaerales bacterium]|nr:hypothetical protein [Phycisphaerales bacterium]